MNGGFNRDRLPTWPEYADREGLTLVGRGRWRSLRCDFHDDSEPSLRVNIETGGWVCMACGERGGDALAHYMRRTGLDFAQAAQALGAWVEGGTDRPTTRRLSARDALEALPVELGICCVVIADLRAGTVPNAEDWTRFLAAAGRVEFIAQAATR